MGEVMDTKEKKTLIVPAIKAFDHYDFSRAKMRSSLKWLVAKAYGTDSVPADLKEPFYTDQYEQEHLKPPVTNLLVSADLYCRAASLILKSAAATPLVGHDDVIQALAQRGLYVTDQDRLVTERDLRSRTLLMSAHLAMVDALMMAYAADVVSVEKVVASMQQRSPCDHDVHTPHNTEDALTSWINKVNEYLKDIVTQEQRKRETLSSQPAGSPRSPTKWYMKLVPARYRKEQACAQQAPWLPPVDDLLKDNADGSALAALLHFYCPQLLALDDLSLKDNMSLGDRLSNLQLVQDFCKDHLNSCCHFSLEDMVYASSSVKNNYIVFVAELFHWFEVAKPDFVKPRALDPEEPAPLLKGIPSVPISKVTKRSFMERPPSPERPSLPLRPQPLNSGEIKRSTSMSFVDGYTGTWPKEKRSGPYGVSFDIPFGKDDGALAAPPPPLRGMTRSASTDDGLGFRVHHPPPRGMKRNLSFQPVNGQSVGIEEEEGGTEGPAGRRAGGGFTNGHGAAPPSMEEALQIIHDAGRPAQRLRPLAEDIKNGFFLHSPAREPGPGGGPDSASEAESKGAPPSATDTAELDTGVHVETEDMGETLDEDSSLRDCTASMELDMDTPSPVPGGFAKSPSGGVRMTSFAEQKLRKLHPPAGGTDSGRGSSSSLKTTPEGSELGLPLSVSWAPTPEHSPVRQQAPPLAVLAKPIYPAPVPPPDPAQAMATEMVQLRMRLEEKRRAIEAQKTKVEAAFARHRQKMGRSAFLAVVKRKGEGGAGGPEDDGGRGEEGDERRAGSGSPAPPCGRSKVDTPDGAEQGSGDGGTGWLKSPGGGGGEEGGPGAGGGPEAELAEYTRSIEKLNASLAFLQTEMQRLAQQQEVIMAMREQQQQQQAWVIPPPHASANPSPQKHGRAAARSSGPPSPADSPRSAHRSPASLRRKSASFHSRTPRTPRPSELKLAPYSRVLTAPQSVDSIPRLRRFSPCQPLTSAFVYMGDKPAGAPETSAPDWGGSRDTDPLLSPEREASSPASADPSPPCSPAREPHRAGEARGEAKNEEMDTETGMEERKERGQEEIQSIVGTSVSEVLAHPVTETFTPVPLGPPSPARGSLVEVPLSVLKPLEGEALEESAERQATMEGLDDDHKMCCGFFFKDDGKGEDNMAQKRAALLEKRMRRERETQQKKQQLEAEQEQRKEEARVKAEEERLRKEEDKARREFIKQEYVRRKQLKLMEDMDTLIKPRPASTRRRARPKSIHRDGVDSPKTPARGTAAPGSQARVFSVSSLSLASLNLGDSDSGHSEKRAPRSLSLASGRLCFLLSSPKLRRRQDSADGFLSPSRPGSGNGEKDWENGSTTSSITSNTEYTGPKLYKEPSAKSNKHIIQNAMTHCCLAGKVNEGQKNKILEEMEKCEANNFLVLFRDAGCQFRSLYTYFPETEEITKLAGVGPKNISRKMIDGLYKYNSDRKQFSQIPAKTMSASVDAITIQSHLWQTKKPATPKKVVPAKS